MTEFKLIQRNYATFNLQKNPFPYAGVPDTNPQFYIGQKEVLSAIIQTVSTTIVTGKSSHIILTGPYGCGKSHTLLYIKEQLKEYVHENGATPVVGYISQPGDNMLDLYREFMCNIGLATFQTLARNYLAKIATELLTEGKITADITIPATWKNFEAGDLLLADVVPTALVRLNAVANYVDLCKCFINLVYDENALSAWEWLSGEGMDYNKRKILCLSKNIDKKSVGRAFQAIKAILRELQQTPVILMIDEFEAIESFGPLAKQNILNEIRHLIDINGDGLCIIIACAPDVWQSLISEYHAFSERIGKETCLKPLTVEKTKELIQAYIKRECIPGASPIDPFEDDVYGEIFERCLGNSRQILTLCGRLIDCALDGNKEKVNLKLIGSLF